MCYDTPQEHLALRSQNWVTYGSGKYWNSSNNPVKCRFEPCCRGIQHKPNESLRDVWHGGINNSILWPVLLCQWFACTGAYIQNPAYLHYSDVIMSAIVSQFTSLTIVYSTVYSGDDQSKHQSSASLDFVRGIHRWQVNSPYKGPVTRKMFPFWWRHHVNNIKVAAMRRHRLVLGIGSHFYHCLWNPVRESSSLWWDVIVTSKRRNVILT